MEEFKYLIPEESIDAIITNVEKLREIENHLRHVLLLIRCFNTSITKVKMLPCV